MNNIIKKCIICNSLENIQLINKNPICENCFNIQLKLDKQFSSKKTIFHPECVEIIKEKLYLGNSDFSKIKENLKKLNISHILVCGFELETPFQNDFIYMKINLQDKIEDSILPHINKCCEFIKNGKKVFVHCNAAVSRSPSIVIAYLIKEENMNFEDAFNLVKKKRNIIKPNETFFKELLNLNDFK